MKIFDVPYFDNTNKDYSGRLIPDNVLQNSKNIMFDNKKIKSRYGIDQLEGAMPDGGDVIRIALYKQLYNDEVYIVAFTMFNMFYLDPVTAVWKYITRNFCTGTVGNGGVSGIALTYTPPTSDVTIAINTPNTSAVQYTINLTTITGLSVGMIILSGTGITLSPPTFITKIDSINNLVTLSRPTTEIPSGDIVFNFRLQTEWDAPTSYIGFGSNDINAIGTWYPIEAFFNTVTITLKTAQAIANGTPFVIKREYRGGLDNIWHTAFPYDDSMYGGGDKLLLATNGTDLIQKWRGFQNGVLTYAEDTVEYPNLCKHIGFWGTAGQEHIITSNITDASSSKNTSAIELSDAGEISWADGHVYPLYDSSYPILGVVSLQQRFIIYKQNTISMGEPTGEDANPLNIQQDVKRGLGTISIDTVIDTGVFHIFFTGERIAFFDGFNSGYLDDGISNYIGRIINKPFASRSFAFTFPDKNLYCLAIPINGSSVCNYVIVYNYVDKNFTFWDFKNGTTELSFISAGQYINKFTPSWEEFLYNVTDAGATLTGSLATTGIVTFNDAVDLSGVLGGRIVFESEPDTEYYLKTIIDSTHAIIGTQAGKSTVTTADITTITGDTIASTNVILGYTWLQLSTRWIDYSFSGDYNTSVLLGDTGGNIYQVADFMDMDDTVTDTAIESIFETKDFELNKGLTFLSMEVTVRIERLNITETTFYDGDIYLSVSVDYGRTWSTEITLPLDGLVPEFMEKKIALHMRGKAVRLKFRALRPFAFENCFIGYNVQGKAFKFDR